ncbi:MAG: hypothetical protein IJ301_02275 [Clostridia bacterium]|nr:hypothetical protein [Clostridia bacterium]
MGKFEKLKSYNLMLMILVPLLIVAMVATVTLAAMTVSKDGKNTIQIGGVGSITCTATATGLYPGSTQNISLVFSYAGDTNTSANVANSIILDFATFKFTSVKAVSGSNASGYTVNLNNTNAHNMPVYFSSYDLFLLNSSTSIKDSKVTVTKGSPVTIILAAVLKEGINDNLGTSNANATPANYLMNSTNNLIMNFTISATTA